MKKELALVHFYVKLTIHYSWSYNIKSSVLDKFFALILWDWAYNYFETELAPVYFYVKLTFTTVDTIKSLISDQFFTAALWDRV